MIVKSYKEDMRYSLMKRSENVLRYKQNDKYFCSTTDPVQANNDPSEDAPARRVNVIEKEKKY